MKEKFINECSIIQQNCTYTAEAHHHMASTSKNKAILFEVVPAVGAAISGTLAATGIAVNYLLPITVLASSIAAVASILNPNKSHQDHLSAAKSFTALKHDARFLKDSLSEKLNDDAFVVAVENLHSRYSELLKASPPTNKKSFNNTRKIIQDGIHEPDRDNEGKLL